MAEPRRVLYISGSRADYGPARRLLLALQDQPDFSLSVLACGMHLDPIHGETWREIEADGLPIAERVHGRMSGDSLAAMSASVGLYLHGMSQAIARLSPDIVLVLGDRGEQLAGAMAAAFQNIVVAHLGGGSISGSIDDSVRHAITKFAHYHLAACEEHAQRIIQMGEEPARVHVVGFPGADLREEITASREGVCAKYRLPPDRPYLLVIQHAVTQQQEEAGPQIVETLEGVVASGYPVLLANPNDDAGGRTILGVMQAFADRHPQLRPLPPPRSREWFASVMAHAGALIGNSSSAVAEAMSVGLPVVNIGSRQQGRLRTANIIDVGYPQSEIIKGIQQAVSSEFREMAAKTINPYGDGRASEHIVSVLKRVTLDDRLLTKQFADYSVDSIEDSSSANTVWSGLASGTVDN